MRVKWMLDGRPLDLVNVHLFHDESNINAMQDSPSQYSLSRRNALHYVLSRCRDVEGPSETPLFLFGDLNFRLDLGSVVQHLAREAGGKKLDARDGKTIQLTLLDKHSSDTPLLLLHTKRFLLSTPEVFLEGSGEQFRRFDHEPASFADELKEIPVTFEPSYPYAESVDKPGSFLTKR